MTEKEKILFGQAKVDFNKWFYKVYKNIEITDDVGCGYDGCCDYFIEVDDVFYKLPLSMQFGVMVDFFDTVNICVELDKVDNNWWISIDGCELREPSTNEFLTFKTRSEARIVAIEKATEKYNKRFT